MIVKITKFNAHKLALNFSLIAMLVMLFMSLFFLVFRMVTGAPDFFTSQSIFTYAFYLLPAIGWGVAAYLIVFVGLWIYNRICHSVGYIEFEIDKTDL